MRHAADLKRHGLRALVMLGLLGCGPELSGIFMCGAGGDCPDGLVCDEDRICRKPRRVDAENDVDLWSAPSPDLKPCMPARRCDHDGLECGTVADDGCGKMLDCGKCKDEEQECGVKTPNKCDSP